MKKYLWHAFMKCYHHLILLAVYTLIKRIIIKSEEMLRLYVDSES